jgi:hypothetical protein
LAVRCRNFSADETWPAVQDETHPEIGCRSQRPSHDPPEFLLGNC